MYYLENGLREKGLYPAGRALAVLFALLTIVGSLGIGNMFQANQTLEILGTVSPAFKTYNWVVGIGLAAVVAVVIIGGIRRIGRVTSRIVPFMCVLYVITSLIIIVSHIAEVPAMLAMIISQAFNPNAVYGGFLGVMVTGVRRAVFSNEAGLGSAAFAHAAAKTDEPAREGMVAMIGPFIDTIVICLMTGLVCLITGVYNAPEFQGQQGTAVGVRMTAAAWDSFFSGARYILAVAVVFFAYSTMISWSYYGERAWEYLFGTRIGRHYGLYYDYIDDEIDRHRSHYSDAIVFGDLFVPNSLTYRSPAVAGGSLGLLVEFNDADERGESIDERPRIGRHLSRRGPRIARRLCQLTTTRRSARSSDILRIPARSMCRRFPGVERPGQSRQPCRRCRSGFSPFGSTCDDLGDGSDRCERRRSLRDCRGRPALLRALPRLRRVFQKIG